MIELTARRANDGQTSGDRPGMVCAESQRGKRVRRRDALSAMVIAGIVALVLLLAVVVLWIN